MNGRIPVTSLLFTSENTLLSGSGRSIEIWDVISGNIKAVIKVLEKGTISGIVPIQENEILVYGGRELARVYLDNRQPGSTILLPDRIVDVAMRESEVIVTLSHGQVVIFDASLCIKSRHCLKEDFLLYSASLLLNQDLILIAMGTVFNGIEIYQVDPKREELIRKCQLAGHEGSIFGIACSIDGTFLVSVSDDRTLRKWSLLTPLPDYITTADWVSVGHKSRVWRVRLWDDKIITGAEDSTARIWDRETGDCVRILSGHIGMNIWALATRGKMIATGGDDCSIRMWNISKIKDTLISKIDSPILGYEPKWFSILSSGSLATLFADGSVDGYNCSIPKDKINKNAIFKVIGNLLLIGNLRGILFVQITQLAAVELDRKSTFHSADEHTILEIDCKFTARIVYIDAWILDSNCTILLQSGTGQISVICLNMTTKEYRVFNGPEIKGIIVICSQFLENKSLLLGTRDGKLLVFDFKARKITSPTTVSTEAVTCITFVSPLVLLVTDRSGSLSSYRFDKNQDLILEWRQKITKSWLERVIALPDDNVLVAGFEGTCFFVFNFTTKQEILRISTGGHHRLWSLTLCQEELIFAFIRLGKVYTFKHPTGDDPCKIIKAPLHGGEIRATATIDEHAFITAGEDGRLVVMNSKLEILESIVAHRSGIKAIAVSKDLVYAAGSAEELTCWRWSGANLCKMSSAPCISKVKEVRIMDISVQGKVLIAAYSDSFVRAWSCSNHQFTFLSEIEAHQDHCCLKLVTLMIENELICFTGGTDGRLVKSVLREGKFLCYISSAKLHQSGINAIAVDSASVLTGGDDGKLTLVDHNLSIIAENQSAHHSTITAVALSPHPVSVSIDQRLIHWSATLTSPRSTRIQIPDPSTLPPAGCGIEIT